MRQSAQICVPEFFFGRAEISYERVEDNKTLKKSRKRESDNINKSPLKLGFPIENGVSNGA